MNKSDQHITNQQRDFALARIDSIKRRKKQELEEIVEKEQKQPSDDDYAAMRVHQFRSGKVKLKPGVRMIDAYDKVSSIFDFGLKEKERENSSVIVRKRFRAIEKEAGKISDKIMFSADPKMVESMIQSFDDKPVK